MKISFKNSENTYECSDAVEQKICVGDSVKWKFIITIKGDFTSATIDSEITPVSVSEIRLITEEGERIVTGYNKILSCNIRHTDKGSVTDIHLQTQEEKVTE